RGLIVTGVQTCALPICTPHGASGVTSGSAPRSRRNSAVSARHVSVSAGPPALLSDGVLLPETPADWFLWPIHSSTLRMVTRRTRSEEHTSELQSRSALV